MNERRDTDAPLRPFDGKGLRTVEMLGLRLHVLTLDETLRCIRDAVDQRRRLFLSTVNVNFIALASREDTFRQSIEASDLCVADGWPLVRLSRWLCDRPLPERVAGADLFERLLYDTQRPPLHVYFFGGPAGAAQEACRKVNRREGGLHCVGHANPGFGDVASMSDPETIGRINARGVDILVVALGAQKGQAWILHNLPQLNVPVVSHWGAVVNFAAGRVRRAPSWAIRLRLEWLWRVFQEPALWRRYLGDACCLARMLLRTR